MSYCTCCRKKIDKMLKKYEIVQDKELKNQAILQITKEEEAREEVLKKGHYHNDCELINKCCICFDTRQMMNYNNLAISRNYCERCRQKIKKL